MNKDVTIDASKCLSSIQRTLVSTYMSTALWWCTLYFMNQFQGDKKTLYNPFFFSFECQFVVSAILFEIQISLLRYFVNNRIGLKDFWVLYRNSSVTIWRLFPNLTALFFFWVPIWSIGHVFSLKFKEISCQKDWCQGFLCCITSETQH